jgi:hypothetical protein
MASGSVKIHTRISTQHGQGKHSASSPGIPRNLDISSDLTVRGIHGSLATGRSGFRGKQLTVSSLGAAQKKSLNDSAPVHIL